jgi:FkbM family methyltransferase
MRSEAPPLKLRNSAVVRAHHGVFLAPSDDLVTEHLEEYGAHTRPFVALALALIRPGDIVLDIGAHIGSFTIPLARAVWPDGVVVAFEPNDFTSEVLEINVELNDLSRVVEVEHIALSDTQRVFTIDTPRSNTGASHLTLEEADESSITTSTLSDWFATTHLETLDFIKVDVEGMEMQVLAGGREILDRFTPTMLIEVDEQQLDRYGSSLEELDDLLVASDYRMFLHTGPRNVDNDDFEIAEIDSLPTSDELYDVLAIHRGNERITAFLEQAQSDHSHQGTEHEHAS